MVNQALSMLLPACVLVVVVVVVLACLLACLPARASAATDGCLGGFFFLLS
jgi:hypothetical protein